MVPSRSSPRASPSLPPLRVLKSVHRKVEAESLPPECGLDLGPASSGENAAKEMVCGFWDRVVGGAAASPSALGHQLWGRPGAQAALQGQRSGEPGLLPAASCKGLQVTQPQPTPDGASWETRARATRPSGSQTPDPQTLCDNKCV